MQLHFDSDVKQSIFDEMEKSISTENMNPEEALQHLKSVVENIAKDAQSIPQKYSSILLICFCWEEDDVLGSKDCDDISNVFKEIYGAEIVRIVLEMKEYTPIDVLHLIPLVVPFIKEAQLVVLFYSGHGSSDKGLVWHPKGGDFSQRLDFQMLEKTLLNSLKSFADVLLLLDCCCAVSCLKGGAQKITHEVIGASGSAAPTPQRSFTPALCKILRECPPGIGMTMGQVHNILLHTIKTSPIHTFLIGQDSIRLVPAGNDQIVSARAKEVVVCIRLCEDLPPSVVAEFMEFLAKKPELTGTGYVKLLDTLKSDSTLIFAILPIYLASLLSYVLDVSMLYLA